VVDGVEHILCQIRPFEVALIDLETGLKYGDCLSNNWVISEKDMFWLALGKEIEIKEQ
jgi:hypothetical protein